MAGGAPRNLGGGEERRGGKAARSKAAVVDRNGRDLDRPQLELAARRAALWRPTPSPTCRAAEVWVKRSPEQVCSGRSRPRVDRRGEGRSEGMGLLRIAVASQ